MNPAPNSGVNLFDSCECCLGLRLFVEDDGPYGGHRTMQSCEWIFLKMAVLVHTGGNFGMRKLHQEGAPAHRQENHLPIDSPNRAVLIEESDSGFHTVFNAGHFLKYSCQRVTR